MQQLTTVNPPLSKMWEIALPTPVRLDVPGHNCSFIFVHIFNDTKDLELMADDIPLTFRPRLSTAARHTALALSSRARRNRIFVAVSLTAE